MKRILFITVFGNCSGSELVLFNIIKNVDYEKYKFYYASKKRGELINSILLNVPVYIMTDFNKKRWLVNSYHRLKREIFGIDNQYFLNYLEKKVNVDYWYINTIMQPDVVKYAKERGIPCIVHSHELEGMLLHLSSEDIENLVTYPKLIIANSQASANVLKVLGRDKDLVVLYSPINLTNDITMDKSDIRNKLKIKSDAFLWGMCGYIDNNKNPLRFVEFAKRIINKNKNVHFIWIGVDLNNGLTIFADRKAKQLGIDDKIAWVGTVEPGEVRNYLNALDAFVLTSNQESLSLVAIEAASLGKPILTANCGGPAEFIEKGMGIIVDSFNIDDFADAGLKIMNKEIEIKPSVLVSRAKDFDTVNIVRNWERIIDSIN